jgi:hypothetical protein
LKNCPNSNTVITRDLNCITPILSCGKQKEPTNLNIEDSWKAVTWKNGLDFVGVVVGSYGVGLGWEFKTAYLDILEGNL